MFTIEYDLVIHILEYYFGHAAAKIARQLLIRGPMSLHKLVNYSEYKFKIVRNTLVVMIQYGIVEYNLQTTTYGNRLVTHVLYSIKSENVMSLMLIPFLLVIAKEKLDKNCQQILLQMAKYGILSVRKIKEGLKELEHQTIFDSLSKLINAGYLMAVETYEQHKKNHMELSENIQEKSDFLSNLANEKYSTASGLAYGLNDNNLYKMDFNFLVDHFVKDEIELLIYSRVGDNSMIKVVLNILMQNNGKIPNYMDYGQIESEVMSSKDGQNIKPDYLQRLLNGLNKHPDNLVVYSPQDRTYHFEWYKAKKMLKEKAIFGSVKRLLGIKAARLWNLLVKESEKNPLVRLETYKITEKALVSPQTARSNLYALTVKGFAKVCETDLSGQQVRMTDKPLYFTTSIDYSCCQLIKMGYKFASNLIERLVYERKREFQRNFMVNGNNGTKFEQNDADLVEIHLLHVIKFIVIMRQL